MSAKYIASDATPARASVAHGSATGKSVRPALPSASAVTAYDTSVAMAEPWMPMRGTRMKLSAMLSPAQPSTMVMMVRVLRWMKRPAPSIELVPSTTMPPMTHGSTNAAPAYLSDANDGNSSVPTAASPATIGMPMSMYV